MKTFDRLILGIFSNIILIIGLIICLVLFGWLNLDILGLFTNKILANSVFSNIVLAVTIVCMLLAIKCIFFVSDGKETEGRDGILLENADGKLLISKDTLKNLVEGVAKEFDNAENVVADIVLDQENKVTVFLSMNVKENAVIKELSNNLQTKIKVAIKKTSDLEVEAVNIKVRDIEYTQADKQTK